MKKTRMMAEIDASHRIIAGLTGEYEDRRRSTLLAIECIEMFCRRIREILDGAPLP